MGILMLEERCGIKNLIVFNWELQSSNEKTFYGKEGMGISRNNKIMAFCRND